MKISLIVATFFAPVYVFGAEFQPISPISTLNTGGSLVDFLNSAFQLSISVGAVLAVIMIMVGGFGYLFSEVPSAKEEGRRRIQEAVLGLLLLLFSWLLLYIINPNILKLDFLTNLQSIGSSIPAPSASKPKKQQEQIVNPENPTITKNFKTKEEAEAFMRDCNGSKDANSNGIKLNRGSLIRDGSNDTYDVTCVYRVYSPPVSGGPI